MATRRQDVREWGEGRLSTGTDARNDLFKRAKRGDRAARNEVVMKNRTLVYRVIRSLGLTKDHDLVQVGMLGLIDAAKGFDPSLGHAFSTFAFRCIRHEIFKFLNRHRQPLACSLDAFLEGDGITWLTDSRYARPDHEVERREEASRVRAALETIGASRREVLTRRVGLDRDEQNLEEIAVSMGISQQRAGQIERDGLARLARCLGARRPKLSLSGRPL